MEEFRLPFVLLTYYCERMKILNFLLQDFTQTKMAMFKKIIIF